jgi:hypothetical protein
MNTVDTFARNKRNKRLLIMLVLLAASFYAGIIILMGLQG